MTIARAMALFWTRCLAASSSRVADLTLLGTRGHLPARSRLCRPMILLFCLPSMSTLAIPLHAEPLTVAQFGELALRCGSSVAPLTLAAVAKTESRFEPLTINDTPAGVTGVPATPAIAAQLATSLLEAGHSLDLGLMQINSANLRRLGLTPDAAFDPCHSIAAAAAILTGAYAGGDTHSEQQVALRGALSAYNTGDTVSGVANGYVHKVELAARQVVPAIDVGAVQASASPAAAVPVAPAPLPPPPASNPDAPPSWNVWASFEYDAAGRFGRHPDEAVAPGSASVLTDAQVATDASVVTPIPPAGSLQ